jgi:hypothetical protein
MILTTTDLFTYLPAILVLWGASTGLKTAHCRWPHGLGIVGATLMITSWAIRSLAWKGDLLTTTLSGEVTPQAQTMLRWVDVSSDLYLSGWWLIAIGLCVALKCKPQHENTEPSAPPNPHSPSAHGAGGR